ncbi:MAG: hypothetical protein DRI86_09255 [Bacteroidetes bacterium]|nr:MAG: hypothetical protein DRI86_09255 [Bacteroidota bacterium]
MRNKTKISITISLVIIILAIVTILNQKNSTISNDFLLSDTASVVKIFMVNKQNESITLSKSGKDWLVNGKDKAIAENVNIILKTLMYIEIRQPVSKNSYNTMIKQLATNSVKVEIYENGYLINFAGLHLFQKVKKSKVFYVGSPTRNYKGTIMMMEGSKDIYVTYLPGFNGYLTERFSANYADWINHNFFKIPIRSILKVKVEFGVEPMQSYEIQNIGNRKFNLISLHTNNTLAYDTTRVLEELASFRSINFEALLDDMPKHTLDSLENSIPLRTVTLTTIDQKNIRIRMYHRPNFDNKVDFSGKYFPYDMDRMYALVDNFKHPVSVQFFVVDNITRTLNYLIGKEKRKTEGMEGFLIGK